MPFHPGPVRTLVRLRAAPASAAVFALLTCLTVFLAAALPRASDTFGNRALGETLATGPTEDRLFSVATDTLTLEKFPAEPGKPVELPDLGPSSWERGADALRRELPAPLRFDGASATYGVTGVAREPVLGGDLSRPTPERAPEVTLLAQHDLARHSDLVAGRMPGPRVTRDSGDVGVETALTSATARRMGLAVGDAFRLATRDGRMTVTVTGLVRPLDPRSVHWNAEKHLLRPALTVDRPPPPAPPERYWIFTAHLHPEAAYALYQFPAGASLYWHVSLDRDLEGAAVPRLLDRIRDLETGPAGTRIEQGTALGELTSGGGLQGLLTGYLAQRESLEPLLLTAFLGLQAAAVSVLLLWALLTAARRRAELDLLRARGCSLPGLARRLLAESAVVALPAAAVGTAAALLLTTGTGGGPALLAAGAATALAVLAVPAAAVPAHRRPLVRDRADLTRSRPSRRRTVAELTVLVLAAAAVAALRGRVQDGAGGAREADPLVAAAPVCVAVGAAVVLLRLYPLPLRLLSRAAARRRGPAVFLGLARAGRAPSAHLLPLVTLLVTLTVASFGGSVLAGVDAGRDRAALREVGADARVAAPVLRAGLPGELALIEGVEEVSASRVLDGEVMGTAEPVTVVVADAPAYAALAARTGLGAYPASALDGGEAGALPALLSPGLADLAGASTVDVTVPGLPLTVRAAAVRQETPAARSEEFVVLSRQALERARPDVRGTDLVVPNTLLVTGTRIDGRALREQAGDAAGVALRTEERRDLEDSPLQTGAQDLYGAAVLTAGAFSALAVLLSLLQTARERVGLLSRLHALGLPRRHGRWLLLAESLPLYGLTAAAGALTGLGTTLLLGPGVDLTVLAGTPDGLPLTLTVAPLWLVLPGVCLVAVACAVLFLQARHAARGTARHTPWEAP